MNSFVQFKLRRSTYKHIFVLYIIGYFKEIKRRKMIGKTDNK